MSADATVRLPEEPQSGAEIPRSWFGAFYRAVKAFMRAPVVGDGRTIRVQGRVVSAIEQPGGRPAPLAVAVPSSQTEADIYVGGADAAVHEDAPFEAAESALVKTGCAYPATLLLVSGTPKWVGVSAPVVGVDASQTPAYAVDIWNETGTKDTNDVLIYRDALQGSNPDKKLRLYAKLVDLRTATGAYGDLGGTPEKVLARDSSGNVGWYTIEQCATTTTTTTTT